MKTEITDKGLVLTIPTDYLKRAVEQGLTTGMECKVLEEKEMLEHYAFALDGVEDDNKFGSLLDVIASDAAENGDSWLELEDDD